MEKPLIYVFDDFAAAEKARGELVANGFDPAGVELSVRDDEAGPAQGNFTVGDQAEADYKDAFAKVRHRGNCMLTITPVDPTQAQYALALLARYGVTERVAPKP